MKNCKLFDLPGETE